MAGGRKLIITRNKYSSYDTSRLKKQLKEVRALTGNENAPRNLADRVVNNLAYTIRTADKDNSLPSKYKVRRKPKKVKAANVSIETVAKDNKSEEKKQARQTVQSASTAKESSAGAIHYQNRDTPRISRRRTIAAAKHVSNGVKTGVDKTVGIKAKAAQETIIDKVKIHTTVANGIKTYSRESSEAVRNALSAEDDSLAGVGIGIGSVASAIDAGEAAYSSIKGAQTASRLTIAGVRAASKGGYKVVNTSYKAARKAYDIAGYGTFRIQTGTLRINRNTIRNVIAAAQPGAVALAKSTGKAGFEVIKKSGGAVVKGVPSGVVKGVKNSISGGVTSAGELAAAQDDIGAQAFGMGVKYTELGIKTAKAAPLVAVKAIKTGFSIPVKTAHGIRKTGRGVYNFANSIKRQGTRATFNQYREKARQNIAKAGKSAVTAIFDGIKAGFKSLGYKIILPLILISGVVAAANLLISTPVSALGGIFGSSFTMENTDYDMHDYLMSVIPGRKAEFIQEIINECNSNLVDNYGYYHYVRLFKESSDNLIADTKDGPLQRDDISALFRDNDIANVMQPFFNIILLTEYDLEPTQEEIDDIFEELWSSIFIVTEEELPVEYCVGITDPAPHYYCNYYHADISTCPNYVSGVHSSYICNLCCYITMVGHRCHGYNYCDGHRILGVTIHMDGVYQLMVKYFTDPIDSLSNLASRTQAQEEELQQLIDNYELCLEFINVVYTSYGGGLTMEDLSGVVFINGSRSGNQSIIDLALSQVGQMGGQPYWSWYGFSSRVEWCACFVSWCANQLGFLSNNTLPKFCGCSAGVNWFIDHGQWAARGFTDLCPGDVIFFDWDLNGVPNHVGFVIGTDGENVYTVEGNSGDAVRIRRYSLTSMVILGYGIPNY